MAQNPGIFVRTNEKDIGLVIQGCTELLSKFSDRTTFINGLKYDGNYGGFRVFFNDGGVVQSFLKQGFLPSPGKSASIHSLTTKLTVHSIFPDSDEFFKKEITEQLEKLQLKPVINVSFIPVSPEYSFMKTGDWLIELDVPEIETLSIFENIGLSDDTRIQLKVKSNEPCQEVKLSYYCSICNSTDHSRKRCPSFTKVIGIASDNSPEPNLLRSTEISNRTQNNGNSNFEIRDRIEGNTSSPSVSKTAKQHRLEAIASDLERKQIKLSNLKPHKEIKQEQNELFQTFPKVEISLKRSLKENNNNQNSSKRFHFAPKCEIQPNEDAIPESNSCLISTTEIYDYKCDIKSIDLSLNPSSEKPGFLFEKDNDSSEDYSLPNLNLPTSSQPETSFEAFRVDLKKANRDASDHSDSNESFKFPSRTRTTRKKPTYAPVVLPDRIRMIVQSRELLAGELGVVELEAFFNHVKKKMSPAKIAKQFTQDAQCLREQLIWIKQQYYLTPKAGSGEDSRFMKWLEGMLDRFDSTPSKRRKPNLPLID